MFRCSRKVSLVRQKTSCSILSYFHNGIFRNLFVNGKQRERQLIHVQLVLAYSCPHLFCILKKSGKVKLLHQHSKLHIASFLKRVSHFWSVSRWSIEYNRRKVGNARCRINNSTFYNKASMTSSIAGKIPICGFVEGCWHLKEGRETPLTSIQVIAVENALFYCIRQERDRLLIRKCWSRGRLIFLISVLLLESWSIGRWARGLKRVNWWIISTLLHYLDVLIKRQSPFAFLKSRFRLV